jgi:hypothetical protein
MAPLPLGRILATPGAINLLFRITRRTIETLGFNPSGQETIESGPKWTFEGRRA